MNLGSSKAYIVIISQGGLTCMKVLHGNVTAHKMSFCLAHIELDAASYKKNLLPRWEKGVVLKEELSLQGHVSAFIEK